MKSITKKISTTTLKSVFKKDQKFTNTCKICNMKFASPDRTKRHMIKAHTKPRQEKQTN